MPDWFLPVKDGDRLVFVGEDGEARNRKYIGGERIDDGPLTEEQLETMRRLYGERV